MNKKFYNGLWHGLHNNVRIENRRHVCVNCTLFLGGSQHYLQSRSLGGQVTHLYIPDTFIIM